MFKGVFFAVLFSLVSYMLFVQVDSSLPSFPNVAIDCIGWNSYKSRPYEPKFNQKVDIVDLRSDLRQIRKLTTCVRVYHSTGSMEEAINFGSEIGLRFILGIYLSRAPIRSAYEVKNALHLSNKYKNIVAIIVGNENISQHKFGTVDGLGKNKVLNYLKHIRSIVKIPVSTSELPTVWLKNPDLAAEVDFLGLNLLPYWHKVDVRTSGSWLVEQVKAIKKRFPEKPLFVTETGWPTRGANNSAAKASPKNQTIFIKQLIQSTHKLTQELQNQIGLQFSLFEAFDQPWKANLFEGRIGAHWGIHNAFGQFKYSLEKKEISKKQKAIVASILGLIMSLFLFWLCPRRNFSSIFLQAFWVQVCTTVYIFVVSGAHLDYLINGMNGLWLIPFLLVPTLISHWFVNESCIALELANNTKIDEQEAIQPPSFVSVHVACSNERPDRVVACVESILEQLHNKLEVVLVDNNTARKELWLPLKAKYAGHKRVKFLHFPTLAGFKAGALNQALLATDPQADFIAVLDADYIAEPNWLSEGLAEFHEDTLAVQYPQAYEEDKNPVKLAMHDEYIGFFQSGMPVRAKYNSIILHGTMVLVRREYLNELKWNEKSICEDAYLGLDLLKKGGELKYINKVMGKGVLPATYQAYLDQRFRWVYGGIRILIENTPSILSSNSRLSNYQLFYYAAGWLPWLAEIFFLLFWIPGMWIAWFMIWKAELVPAGVLLIPYIVLIFIRLISTLLVYARNQTCSFPRVILAIVSGISLTYTVALAAFTAIWFKSFPFIRTQKGIQSENSKLSTTMQRAIYKLNRCHPDVFVSFIFSFFICLVMSRHGISDIDRNLWMLCFLCIALPGFCKATLLAAEEMRGRLFNI